MPRELAHCRREVDVKELTEDRAHHGTAIGDVAIEQHVWVGNLHPFVAWDDVVHEAEMASGTAQVHKTT